MGTRLTVSVALAVYRAHPPLKGIGILCFSVSSSVFYPHPTSALPRGNFTRTNTYQQKKSPSNIRTLPEPNILLHLHHSNKPIVKFDRHLRPACGSKQALLRGLRPNSVSPQETQYGVCPSRFIYCDIWKLATLTASQFPLSISSPTELQRSLPTRQLRLGME